MERTTIWGKLPLLTGNWKQSKTKAKIFQGMKSCPFILQRQNETGGLWKDIWLFLYLNLKETSGENSNYNCN